MMRQTSPNSSSASRRTDEPPGQTPARSMPRWSTKRRSARPARNHTRSRRKPAFWVGRASAKSRVRISAAGLCTSDLSIMALRWRWSPYPSVAAARRTVKGVQRVTSGLEATTRRSPAQACCAFHRVVSVEQPAGRPLDHPSAGAGREQFHL